MELNKYIDHTNLNAFATTLDIKKLCEEALKYNFKSVCVNPCNVILAKEFLSNSDVEVCTVIGFPLGSNTTSIKCMEASDAIKNGATEIDMVINIGRLKDKNYEYIKNEISEIRKITNAYILKVIIETCYLDVDEIKIITEICNELKVDFIKTSTGFGSVGATLENVEIINLNKNNNLEIKASGGIRDYKKTKEMISAGATRIGTSSGVKIMEEFENEII